MVVEIRVKGTEEVSLIGLTVGHLSLVLSCRLSSSRAHQFHPPQHLTMTTPSRQTGWAQQDTTCLHACEDHVSYTEPIKTHNQQNLIGIWCNGRDKCCSVNSSRYPAEQYMWKLPVCSWKAPTTCVRVAGSVAVFTISQSLCVSTAHACFSAGLPSLRMHWTALWGWRWFLLSRSYFERALSSLHTPQLKRFQWVYPFNLFLIVACLSL